MPEETVTITLSPDEALVLRAFVERGDETGDYSLVHGGEVAALWRLEGALDRVIVPPDGDDSYEQSLEAARDRLAEQAGTKDSLLSPQGGPP
ncbi:hypothetical protein [Rubrivirga sp.]|uniref:hypothetical protein n=1 Tax=Rubrivirga sp. TaxID=1885344 RepID=UPI003B51FCBC